MVQLKAGYQLEAVGFSGFQFLMVQLKDGSGEETHLLDVVSIPYGSIKRNDTIAGCRTW